MAEKRKANKKGNNKNTVKKNQTKKVVSNNNNTITITGDMTGKSRISSRQVLFGRFSTIKLLSTSSMPDAMFILTTLTNQYR